MHPSRVLMLFLGLVALACGSPALGDDKAVKDELKSQQGTWTATSSIYEGQAVPEPLARTIQRIVEGDHVVWKRSGKSFAGTKIVLDPAKEPKAIDVIPDGGPHRDKRVLGIYKVNGDKLTICMATPDAPRPTAFRAEKGSGWTLRTFIREQPPAK